MYRVPWDPSRCPYRPSSPHQRIVRDKLAFLHRRIHEVLNAFGGLVQDHSYSRGFLRTFSAANLLPGLRPTILSWSLLAFGGSLPRRTRYGRRRYFRRSENLLHGHTWRRRLEDDQRRRRLVSDL